MRAEGVRVERPAWRGTDLGLSAERTASVAAVCLALAVAALLIAGDRPWVFTVDDAYITLHNAQALWRGSDPNFGAPGLYGATSPAHLLLVAAAQRLLPPVPAQLTLSVLAFALYLRNAAVMAARSGAAAWQVAVVLGAATLGGWSLFHLFNGLESGLAAAAVGGLILLIERGPSRSAALLCGLLPFVRPELGLLSAAALARQAWIRRGQGAGWIRAAGVDLLLAAGAAAPFLAWNLATFHAVLPNTVSAKRWYFADAFTWRQNLAVVVDVTAKAFGPMMLGLLLAPRSSLKAGLLLFVALFYAGYGLMLPPALAWVNGVYLFVLTPVWLWGLCKIAARRRLFVAVSALMAAWLTVTLPAQVRAFAAFTAQVRDGLAVGRWIGAALPPGAVVLVHDDGAVAEGNRARLVDSVGLKTPWVPAVHARVTAPSQGRRRGEAIDEIARRAGARYVVAFHDPARFWYATATDLSARGWTLTLVRPRRVENGYDVFRLEPPRPR
jgi:hypothetical protein